MSEERLEEILENVITERVFFENSDNSKSRWGMTCLLSDEDFGWLVSQANRAEEIEAENIQITDLLVKMRETFTEQDESAEGHGMEDAISCPTAVAQYALNKLNRTLDENRRFREALEEIADYDWETHDEVVGMARQALEDVNHG